MDTGTAFLSCFYWGSIPFTVTIFTNKIITMKLKRINSGEYTGETTVDGIHVKLDVNSINGRGFSFNYYVNGSLKWDDGWYGLRLKDIKDGIDNDIAYLVEEYKKDK